MPAENNHPLSLYVHWPFCLSKCPYCDFNSHVREKRHESAFEEGYITQLTHFAEILGTRRCRSIFFGGGTPSLMDPDFVARLITAIDGCFPLTEDCEITLEANPTSVEATKFAAFRAASVNRISLGIQSLRPEGLMFLGREHDVTQAKTAITLAKSLFDRVSFDLIYALPGQTVDAWQEELAEALTLAGTHLSLYQLTIEKGTPFYLAHRAKTFTLPDEAEAATLFTHTNEWMCAAGMPPYEVSNYAVAGHECRHNLTYWEYRDYLGIGPGAHSRFSGTAVMHHHLPEAWLRAVNGESRGVQQSTTLSGQERTEEALLMGLRLYRGISLREFQEKTGLDMLPLLRGAKIHRLLDAELLHHEGDRLRVTSEGMLVLNQIIAALLEIISGYFTRRSR